MNEQKLRQEIAEAVQSYFEERQYVDISPTDVIDIIDPEFYSRKNNEQATV